MDDAKAAGPKLKWWSRPEQAPAPGQPAGAAAAAPEPDTSGTETSGDWVVRPPRPAPDAAPEPAADATAPAGEFPDPRAVRETDSGDDPRGARDAGSTGDAHDGGHGAGGEHTGDSGHDGVDTQVGGTARELADAATGMSDAPAAADDTTAATPALAPAPTERSAATMTLGQVPADATAAAGTAPQAAPADAAPPAPSGGRAPRQQPLHPEDPYGTPPYGGPGPWAPAPPVQAPFPTPSHQVEQGSPLAPERPTGGFVPHPGDGGPRPAPPAAPGAGAVPPALEAARAAEAPVTRAAFAPPPPTAPGAWQQYDPWSAPRPAGPAAAHPPRRRGRRPALVAGAVALALLAGGVGGVVGAYVERYGGIDDIRLPQVAGDGGGRSPESVAGIARAVLPGVVTLHVRGNAEQGTGTGFVLDRKGHILTNNHVVEPAGTGGEISVTFSGGQSARAKVVGRDGGYDLAVVQVEGVSGLHPLTLGDSDAAQVGDPVVAIGAPYDLANTVTSGIISAKQRPITAGGKKGDGSDVSYVDALQTDAPINPGNSGGPLVDAKARVIGINSAIRAADSGTGGLDGGGQGGSIGLGFAIPINQAKWVAEELINTGRAAHPVIGVTLEMEYDGDGAKVSGDGRTGAQPVTPGGPGARAGLRPGDVITQVDGAPVHSGEELIIKVRGHRPGDTLTLTVQRGGAERSVRLTLGSSGGS
ncbi:trypsin-like peptidase domain-containing protein [Streptomyces sp. BHT-5-2]|uniref:S1C family serine protease n=1 Tax=Streptomyces sp. BHT-5-2 TaxID=2866715 RepID=UPI001C8E7356|nr:trypsin-like peptidase domain-containing protein [Streptomyces sp. BHT-5-2]QZL03803.1 trypsin-like peptidase domain-containing protein [Streptomyces sp. BHT-5-2]